jgi:hypothetical protein
MEVLFFKPSYEFMTHSITGVRRDRCQSLLGCGEFCLVGKLTKRIFALCDERIGQGKRVRVT